MFPPTTAWSLLLSDARVQFVQVKGRGRLHSYISSKPTSRTHRRASFRPGHRFNTRRLVRVKMFCCKKFASRQLASAQEGRRVSPTSAAPAICSRRLDTPPHARNNIQAEPAKSSVHPVRQDVRVVHAIAGR